ncbi:hypothetical protein K432DRAFT_302073 [Lepidopterella palustris CBS 459.81]|uniref:DUF1308 domain-containing protein n=1 Tax=Lepidopterella palustris CBS 459.81 TaxID=1314670 RepID=A0A8E2JDV0_9PEZI|nr:hypothetical protein K432DRAFT_302073 [Lepidopterella palustris CBS 459.81]
MKTLKIQNEHDDDDKYDESEDELEGVEEEERTAELSDTVNDLIQRCTVILAEVEQWIEALHEHKLSKGQRPVEYRSLRNDFKSELSFLQKLAEKNLSEEKARHYIVSSNLLYYEALWAAAKRSSGLLSFRKNFFWNRDIDHRQKLTQGGSKSLAKSNRGDKQSKPSALVDIVACDGLEWIRVSTVSEKRLLFDLAKLGWQNDAFSSSDSDSDLEDQPNKPSVSKFNDEDEVLLVKNARDLARAAAVNRISGKQPRVRFILTRISSGKVKEIDAVLAKVRATGAILQCENDLEPTPPLASVLPNLLVDRSKNLSEVLNIDCTILLAVISDISHYDVPMQDWFPRAVKAQIGSERENRLLPNQLYPTMGGHAMVCTEEAANQMLEIVATIGTDTEKARAQLLLDFASISSTPETPPKPRDQLLAEWATLSAYPVPPDFHLPITVVAPAISFATLPSVAQAVAAELSTINKSVFLYGWAQGLTTLSSNRTTAKQIEKVIEERGGVKGEGEVGPDIWLCSEARSLVAKQGRRK